MQVYVCVKHVPDTATNIRPLGGAAFDESVKFIMNPYDEYALEEALRLREKTGNCTVIAVTLGREAATSTLRAALSLGADRAILVRTERTFTDSLETARLLKEAIARDGSPDLIFMGKQSVDTEGMQTPYHIAASFDFPVAVNVVSFSLADGGVKVERELEGDEREVIEMTLPCVIGATKGLNVPRSATLPGTMKARKKEITVIPEADLPADDTPPATVLMDLQPAADRGRGKILSGDPDVMVRELLLLLRREAKVLKEG